MFNPLSLEFQPNILLVDDTPKNLHLLQDILKESGYKVRAVLNGTLALKAVKAAKPDLILLDIKMPEMDGYEVCRILKSQAETADIPIIFISALDDVTDKVKAFEAGGVDYITKPLNAHEVMVRVNHQILIHQQKQQLQAQNQQLKLLERAITASSNGIVISDATKPDNPVVYVNPGFEQITGYSREDIIGTNCRFLQGGETQQPELNKLRQALHEKRPCEVTLRNYKKDGTLFWNQFSIAPVQDDQGQVTHFIGVQKDITELKQMNAAVQENAARFRAAAEGGLDSFVIFHSLRDETNQIIDFFFFYLNSNAEEFLETTAKDIIGESLRECYPLSSIPEFFSQCVNVVKTRKVWEAELSLAEQWFQVMVVPLADGIAVTTRDISNRKYAELAIQQSEEKFRDLVEQTSDWIWEIDQQGRFTYVSPQASEITGYELVEILGHTTFDFMEDAEVERFQPIIGDSISQQLPFCGLEKTLIHKQGHPIILETSGSPIFDRDGVWQGYRGIARDITTRKQAEAEIIRTRDLLASIFNESTDALFLVDPQTNLIQDCNQRAVELFEANNKSDLLNIQGHTLQKRGYTPDELQTIFAEMNNADVWSDELEYITKKGNHFWGNLAAKRINVAGQPIHFVRLTDITERKQSDLKLCALSERLNYLLTASPSVIYTCKPNGNYATTYISENVSDILGYQAQQFTEDEQFWIRHIHPDDRQIVYSQLSKLTETNYIDYEYRFRHADDNYRWLYEQVKITKYIHNNQTEYIGHLIDITERKQAEKKLSKSERSLAETQRVANVGSWEFNRLTGEITWSVQTFRIFGLDPSQNEPNYTEFIQRIHPDDQPLLQQAVNQVVSEGTSYQMEYRIIRPDGQMRHLESRAEPVLNSEGEVIQLLGAVQDITERKQREQALRLIVEGTAATTGESFLRSCVGYLAKVLDVDYALICQRVEGGLTQVRSLAFWTGNAWSEPIEYDLDGTPCERVFDGKSCLYSENVQTQFPRDRILVDLGIESYFGAPLIDSHGEIIGNLVVMDTKPMTPDPTKASILQIFAARAGAELERQQVETALRQISQQEREKAEKLEQAYRKLQLTQSQLVQQEKMASLGQLVAGVAHEINNPVSFIYGNIMPARVYANDLLQLTALYQKNYPTPPAEIQAQMELIELEFIQEDFPKLLESMEEGSTRIQNIVRSLRNFSRLDEAKRKKADLHQGIESTLMILQHRLKEQPKRAEIQVIKEFCDLPLVKCYPGELNQVFMNLFSNAIDALEERVRQEPDVTPKLWITTQVQTVNGTSPQKVIIRVADNGVGMSACIQQRLFDPFFTTKPVGQGTGLGLSIAHSIVVKKHEGQLFCNSCVGEGTEFVIELPV